MKEFIILVIQAILTIGVAISWAVFSNSVIQLITLIIYIAAMVMLMKIRNEIRKDDDSS